VKIWSSYKEKEWLGDFGSYVWFGENKNQGVTLFVADGIEIEPLNWFDENIKFIRPFIYKFVYNVRIVNTH
jgi:hypothetical protein